MTKLGRIRLKRSEERQKVNALLGITERTEEQVVELRELTATLSATEVEYRAAVLLEEADATAPAEADAEMRERVELRSRARLTSFFLNALKGRRHSGAEAELVAASGIGDLETVGDDQGVPLEIFDTAEVRERQRKIEERVVAGVPSTVGINLDRIRPHVFANSIAPRLGIEMPRVKSGTYATGTITTPQSASARAASAAVAGVAGAITVQTTAPHSISARLELTIESIAQIGQENYEPILRENLSLALSDELDDQAINGTGSGANISGLFQQLTDPTGTAPSTVADFDDFVSEFADGIDGLWASRNSEVAIVAGVDAYRVAAKAFRDIATSDLGDISFADYAMSKYGGFWTNKRMPDAVSNIQQAILYRMGRSMMGGSGSMRTAVCPHWNMVSIDDIYSGAAQGERYFNVHVLIGD